MTAKKKPQSAYFLFTSRHREATKKQLTAEGAKATAADVAKALGEVWAAMGQEEKDAYKKEAAELAREAEGTHTS